MGLGGRDINVEIKLSNITWGVEVGFGNYKMLMKKGGGC